METTFVLLEESWIQLRSFPVYDSCCISFRRHLLAERTENVSHLFGLVGFWWGASICQLCILMLSLNPNQKINRKTGGHTPTLYPLNAYDILSFSNLGITLVSLQFTLVMKWKCVLCLQRDNAQDLFNILGSMYLAVIFLGINNCSTVLPHVATERTVVYREKFAGMYSSRAYSFAQVRYSCSP